MELPGACKQVSHFLMLKLKYFRTSVCTLIFSVIDEYSK